MSFRCVSRQSVQERAALPRWANESLSVVKPTDTQRRPRRQTFGEIAIHWQAHKGHRNTTQGQVARNLRPHFMPTFGERRLSKITTTQVQSWVEAKSDDLVPSTAIASSRRSSCRLSLIELSRGHCASASNCRRSRVRQSSRCGSNRQRRSPTRLIRGSALLSCCQRAPGCDRESASASRLIESTSAPATARRSPTREDHWAGTEARAAQDQRQLSHVPLRPS